jgi:hypothetical protein
MPKSSLITQKRAETAREGPEKTIQAARYFHIFHNIFAYLSVQIPKPQLYDRRGKDMPDMNFTKQNPVDRGFLPAIFLASPLRKAENTRAKRRIREIEISRNSAWPGSRGPEKETEGGFLEAAPARPRLSGLVNFY